MSDSIIELYGKSVRIELSAAAERALERRDNPIFAEVQLIFGCMIAKRVWFHDDAHEQAVAVNPKLRVWFRPARYEKSCSLDDIDDGAVASDYPMVAGRRGFVPDIVRVDYRAGKWVGDFSYSMDLYRSQNAMLAHG